MLLLSWFFLYYIVPTNMFSQVILKFVVFSLLTTFYNCGPIEAADVSQTTGVLAYVIDSTCPSGWSDLSTDGTYRGRLIKGWNSNTNVGALSGTEISNNNMPMHKHPSWSRRLYFDDSQQTTCSNIGASPKMVDDGAQFFLTQANSAMNDNHPRIQRVALRLCRYTSGPVFNLPPGIVVYLHHSVTECPAGFSPFGDANGRFLVFANSGKNMGSELISAAPAVTTNQGTVGAHEHSMPAVDVQLKRRNAAQTSGCCGPTGAKWKEWRTMEAGTASSNHLNIPYVQLRACEATTTTGTLPLPSPRLIFFYKGQTCPPLFREATARTDGPFSIPFSNIGGRMIFNLYDANVEAGQTNTDGDQLYCATGGCSSNGHASHTHYYGGYNGMPSQDSACVWDGGLLEWTDYRNYGFFFDTDPNMNSLFPYRVMRACSAQEDTKKPTNQPTQQPTTTTPSTSPSTSFPTRNPTNSPTPTKNPTRLPTSGQPTISPTTSVPSKSPTTSRPSRNPTVSIPPTNPTTVGPSMSPTTSVPSKSPTTSKPSRNPTVSSPTKNPTLQPSESPTPSPIWKDVCTEEDEKIFVDYDNYVIQAEQCSSKCRRQIFSKDMDDANTCMENCETLSLYTPLCRSCMRRWILTQDEKCRVPCITSKFSSSCANCTNTFSRPDFSFCSGLKLADLSYGGGDGGKNGPKSEGSNAALISGIALGTIAALAGVIFAGRKIRDRMLENEKLTKEMEVTIFKGEQAYQPPPPKPKFFGVLFKSSAAKLNSSVLGEHNMSTVLSNEDSVRESLENPAYTHPSKLPERVQETSSVVSGLHLRTRYSFHGAEEDELDVPAGTALVAIDKNDNWYFCEDEVTGRVGLIPASYVSVV